MGTSHADRSETVIVELEFLLRCFSHEVAAACSLGRQPVVYTQVV